MLVFCIAEQPVAISTPWNCQSHCVTRCNPSAYRCNSSRSLQMDAPPQRAIIAAGLSPDRTTVQQTFRLMRGFRHNHPAYSVQNCESDLRTVPVDHAGNGCRQSHGHCRLKHRRHAGMTSRNESLAGAAGDHQTPILAAICSILATHHCF